VGQPENVNQAEREHRSDLADRIKYIEAESRMTLSNHDQQPTPEQQIALLKQQLAQAQKLTALGELVGTTTHEFNNVLMTILNYAKLGLRHKDIATRDKALDKILAAANRAAKITNGILSFARNRSSGLEPTDLARVIEDSLVLLEREMNNYRIHIEKHVEPTPQAMANGNQIQQVLLNLLINARQAMPSGGTVNIRLSYDAAAQMVELAVRDTGSGMAPEVMRRIFDPFFSTKTGPDASGKGGTGLGLSMCRDIIEAHHGRIRVDSTIGKGTAFTIKLPAAQVSAATAAVLPTSLAAPIPFAAGSNLPSH
jgi:signal transduction histidine kinase